MGAHHLLTSSWEAQCAKLSIIPCLELTFNVIKALLGLWAQDDFVFNEFIFSHFIGECSLLQIDSVSSLLEHHIKEKNILEEIHILT